MKKKFEQFTNTPGHFLLAMVGQLFQKCLFIHIALGIHPFIFDHITLLETFKIFGHIFDLLRMEFIYLLQWNSNFNGTLDKDAFSWLNCQDKYTIVENSFKKLTKLVTCGFAAANAITTVNTINNFIILKFKVQIFRKTEIFMKNCQIIEKNFNFDFWIFFCTLMKSKN